MTASAGCSWIIRDKTWKSRDGVNSPFLWHTYVAEATMYAEIRKDLWTEG